MCGSAESLGGGSCRACGNSTRNASWRISAVGFTRPTELIVHRTFFFVFGSQDAVAWRDPPIGRKGRPEMMTHESIVARSLAPEDIHSEMYIAVTHVIGQHMPLFCAEQSDLERGEPYRVVWLPRPEHRQPRRVLDVCLPFVLVESARRRTHTLDVRTCRLARLEDRFGRMYFKRIRRRIKQRQKNRT